MLANGHLSNISLWQCISFGASRSQDEALLCSWGQFLLVLDLFPWQILFQHKD